MGSNPTRGTLSSCPDSRGDRRQASGLPRIEGRQRGPSVEYSLTGLGASLLTPLSAPADWALAHHGEIAAAREAAGNAERPPRRT
ncbi:hypothetical protein [Herbidospora galbida]|uniref:hypothetical protein n=1 Tax=Herbidospora galbida TaxID=2575442 RepID=UPI001BB076CF|nr:hypothetical protein [Herbidospora galbida]